MKLIPLVSLLFLSSLSPAGAVGRGEGSGEDRGGEKGKGKVDHSRFRGRMSDRDRKKTLLKIFTPNDNVRLLRPGDSVNFQVGKDEDEKAPYCRALVRGAEKRYLVLYVPDTKPCFFPSRLLRRGAMMVFRSQVLAQRIAESIRYRQILLEQREDFWAQLKELNRSLWSFDQDRVKSVARLEKEILELERKKKETLDLLEARRRENVHLRDKLVVKLDEIKRQLDHHKILPPPPRREPWKEERDLGHPVRPR